MRVSVWVVLGTRRLEYPGPDMWSVPSEEPLSRQRTALRLFYPEHSVAKTDWLRCSRRCYFASRRKACALE